MILLRGSSQRARAHSFSPLQVHLHGRTVGHITPLNLEQFVSDLAIIYMWIVLIFLREWKQSISKHKIHPTYGQYFEV